MEAKRQATRDQTASGMAAEHALLGLLAMSADGKGHGYDLARQFDAGAPLGNIIRVEPGMVYHHLKKLQRLGWVEALPEPRGKPVRRPVAVTAQGLGELQRWLAEPVAHTREIRLDFLVKLYFALLMDPELALRLIAEQRERCSQQVETLTERLNRRSNEQAHPPKEHRFGELVLDMRLAQTEAALAWLDRVGQDALDAVANSAASTGSM